MTSRQSKLAKSEWVYIEIPSNEKPVLQFIMSAFSQPDIAISEVHTLYASTKMAMCDSIDLFLYEQILRPKVEALCQVKATSKSANAILTDSCVAWMREMDKRKDDKTKMSKGTQIRMENVSLSIHREKTDIFELQMLALIHDVVLNKQLLTYACYTLHSLTTKEKGLVPRLHRYFKELVAAILRDVASKRDPKELVIAGLRHAPALLETNPFLIRFSDLTLYSHQKELFRLFADPSLAEVPKLVLYTSPTGTGKTMSPLGLTQSYKVIFVCVARHVGLALAKASLTVGKRVAFAFGCKTSSDIRLHNLAASVFSTHPKSGQIVKIDHSVGNRVELMITDVQSYLIAMRYMLAFFDPFQIIMYWDEPTITMDQENHVLHPCIHQIWSDNQIPQVILSCATLPRRNELQGVFEGFVLHFLEQYEIAGRIFHITSHDHRVSIPLVDKDGKVSLPHLLFPNYNDLYASVVHIESNPILFRYLDLYEIVSFLQKEGYDSQCMHYFRSYEELSVHSVKSFYLDVLRHVKEEEWPAMYTRNKLLSPARFVLTKASRAIQKRYSEEVTSHSEKTTLSRQYSVWESKPTLESTGVLLTTADAWTLTDGPTLFLAKDVDKIARFYLQQSAIPDQVLHVLEEKMKQKEALLLQMDRMEELIDSRENLKGTNQKGANQKSANQKGTNQKSDNENSNQKEVERLTEMMSDMRSRMVNIVLPAKYVPNTKSHSAVWIESDFDIPRNLFVSKLDPLDVECIMSLQVSKERKFLLLMGIGVFDQDDAGDDPQPNHEKPEKANQDEQDDQEKQDQDEKQDQEKEDQQEKQQEQEKVTREGYSSVAYMEKMKELAQNKKLFLIIASSDYIYGTNYAFSCGVLGKDLEDMTPQKIIQAIGRIGRNIACFEDETRPPFTVRCRDNAILYKLFSPFPAINPEAMKMSQLFSYDDVDM
jgi:hypothetical protein